MKFGQYELAAEVTIDWWINYDILTRSYVTWLHITWDIIIIWLFKLMYRDTSLAKH